MLKILYSYDANLDKNKGGREELKLNVEKLFMYDVNSDKNRGGKRNRS